MLTVKDGKFALLDKQLTPSYRKGARDARKDNTSHNLCLSF